MSYPFATCSERRNARDPSPLPYRDLRRDGLCPKVPGHVAFRLAQAELACDRRRSGLRQNDEHSRPAKTTGSRTVLAVVAPKNNDDEQALGDQFFTALGLPLRGHWSTRKPKLMGHLHQYGTQCLIVDDAHDLSLEHLMLIKEVTDQGHLQYGHPLGLCLVAAWASRGLRVPARNALLADMVPASVYGRAYGFERMMDNLGAIGGPLLALGLVSLVGGRTAILLSVIPGVLAALAILYAIRHLPRVTSRERTQLKITVRPLLRGQLGQVLLGVSLFEASNVAAILLILRATHTM